MAAATTGRSHALAELKRSIQNRALLLAAEEGDELKVQTLLQDGADVNFADEDGNTALHWAAGKQRNDVIQLILAQENVKHSAENREKKTALDVSWETKNTSILEMIGQKIMADRKRTLKEYQTPERTDDRIDETFRDATWNGNYDREFSLGDINGILKFFCRPLPQSSTEDFEMIVTLRVKNGHICLFYSKQDKTFFRVESGADGSKTTYNGSITEDRECSDYDQALQTARNVCYWFSDLAVKREKKTKTHESILKKELSQIVQKGESIKDSKKKYRQFFAASLDEIERTKSKVQKCTEILKVLLKEKCDKLNHKSAVALILCLETFAGEDAFSYIQLDDTEQEKLRNMKKFYCRMIYPKHARSKIPNFLTLFKLWRNRLIKNDSAHIISKDFLETELTTGDGGTRSIQSILQDFYNFSLIVYANCTSGREDNPSESLNLENFSRFLHTTYKSLNNKVKKNVGSATLSSNDPQSFFLKFSANVMLFQQEINNLDVMFELLYDLLVNVCPQIQVNSPDLKTKQVDNLRNSVVHDFQTETRNHIWDQLPLVVLHLYRRQLAEKINAILMVLRDEDECLEIKNKFNAALEEVGGNFVNFPLPEQSFIQYENTREEELTEIYIKFLAPLIDRPVSEDDDDLMSSEIIPTIQQIRQFCEQFITLEQLNDDVKFKTRRDKVQMELQEILKIDENQARYTTENIKTLNSTANDKFKKEVLQIVKSLISLVKGDGRKKGLLSYADLLSLIKACKSDATRFSFEKHKGLLKHCLLKVEEKQSVEDVLQHLPDSKKEWEIENGDQKVVVNTFSVVSHVLTLFVEVHEACQIRINSLALAFGDKLFLDYLVRLQTSWIKDKNVFVLKEPFMIYKIIRDVRKIKYTAQYVALLLERIGTMKVIEYSNIKRLTMILGRGGEAVSLECLLRVKGDLRNLVLKAVSEVIIDKTFSEENLEILLRAVCNSERLEGFVTTMIDVLSPVKRTDILTKRIRKLLIEANDITLDLINEKDLTRASQLIASTNELQEKLLENKPFTEDTYITSVRNLHKAKLLNAQGNMETTREESKLLYQKALDILEGGRWGRSMEDGVKEEGKQSTAHRMLALSRKAYTYHLLGRSLYEKRYAVEAMKLAEELWKQMWQYISDHDEPPDCLKEFYMRAKESTRYQDLLSLGQEYLKYLNVSTLKRCVLFYRFQKLKVEENTSGLITLLGEWDTFDMFDQQEASFRKWERTSVVNKKIGIHQTLIKMNLPNDLYYHQLKNFELQMIRFGMLLRHGRYTSTVRHVIHTLGADSSVIKQINRVQSNWRRESDMS